MKTRTVQLKQVVKLQMRVNAVCKEISVPSEIHMMGLAKGALMVSSYEMIRLNGSCHFAYTIMCSDLG